jgi:hypothetical protein
VILIDAHPRQDWLLPAIEKRLREELAALQVEINEEKSRTAGASAAAKASASSALTSVVCAVVAGIGVRAEQHLF